MNQESHKNPHKPRHRGIYLLPNLFTTAALFAGFYAIVAAMHGKFEQAAIAVFIAMILDGLDGRVARLTNTQSAFGAEYDSLSDMASFGLAPALIMYEWALFGMSQYGWQWGKLGWLGAFVYVACAALRLARFNTRASSTDKRYFQGLPSPAAAATLAAFVWVGFDYGLPAKTMAVFALVLTVCIGLLMVSSMSYYSFKEFDFRNKVPFVALLLIVLAIVFASIDPPKVLFTVFSLYALSGPLTWLLRLRRRRRVPSGQD